MESVLSLLLILLFQWYASDVPVLPDELERQAGPAHQGPSEVHLRVAPVHRTDRLQICQVMQAFAIFKYFCHPL